MDILVLSAVLLIIPIIILTLARNKSCVFFLYPFVIFGATLSFIWAGNAPTESIHKISYIVLEKNMHKPIKDIEKALKDNLNECSVDTLKVELKENKYIISYKKNIFEIFNTNIYRNCAIAFNIIIIDGEKFIL